jgi:hypothetical protein
MVKGGGSYFSALGGGGVSGVVMKIVNTGMQVAAQTVQQHMSAVSRQRGAGGADLVQHVAHQRVLAALEPQVCDAVGKKRQALTHLRARTHARTQAHAYTSACAYAHACTDARTKRHTQT